MAKKKTTGRKIRKAPMSVLDSISKSIKAFGSDADLYRASGVPQPTITRLRNKKIYNPSIDVLLDLVKGLGIPLNELVGCK